LIKQRGFILFTIVLLALLVTATIVGLTIVGQHSALLAGNQFAGEQAYYAAESGLAAGLVELKRSGKLPSNPWTQQLAGGSDNSFTVELFGNSGTTDMDIPGGPTIPPGTTYLMSVGESRGRRRLVGATVAPAGGPPQVGALARDYLFVGGATVDAYDSNLGHYGPSTLVGNKELLATNESSGLSYAATNPVNVKGKVFVGPGGDPGSQIGPGVTSQGTETLTAPVDIPEIIVPTGLPKFGKKVVLLGSQTLPPGEYDFVTVGGLGKIRLQSGAKYVIGTLNVLPKGKLEVSGENVEVYIRSRLTNIDLGSIINTTRKAKNLKFFHTRKHGLFLDCWLVGGSQAYFTLLAPDTDVQVGFNAEIYGSLMTSRRLSLLANGALHYDVALRDSSPSGGFAIVSRHRL
jgi:hypothetical protein